MPETETSEADGPASQSPGPEATPETTMPPEPAPDQIPAAPAASLPVPVTATQPPQGAQPPVDSNPNVTTVGAVPSPRDAVFLGAGVGGGRMQDDVMGRGGFAFDLNAGYSFTPELSLTINFGGLYHSMDTTSEANAVEEPEAKKVTYYGVSAGAQTHVLEVLRFSLSGGYYRLGKDGPLKPAEGESSDEDPDRESFWSPGGEASAGVEFFQSPGGGAIALEVRSQVSFPDGQLVWDSFALIGARWYGIGGGQPTPVQARTSSPSGS